MYLENFSSLRLFRHHQESFCYHSLSEELCIMTSHSRHQQGKQHYKKNSVLVHIFSFSLDARNVE